MLQEHISISVVSPVYFGEEVVEDLVNRIRTALTSVTDKFEIILVDDGSLDNSWEKICLLCESDHRITGVRLEKNYGQHAAIRAGLENCNGKWIVVIDCDLQDPPEEIPHLFKAAQPGADTVFGLRNKNWQPFHKRFLSGLFYSVLSLVSGYRFNMRTTNFGIYHHTVIANVLLLNENYFLFPVAVRKVAEKNMFLDVKFSPRQKRKTSYTFSKVIKLASIALFSQTIFYPSKWKLKQKYVISGIKRTEIKI